MTLENTSKYKKLAIGILFDAIGYASFIVPVLGEFFDLFWAPASAWLMSKMYKGRTGKIAAGVSFVEEILPGLDVIPTFTIMWFYTYVIKTPSEETIIEVK